MTPRCRECSRHPGPQDDGSYVVLYSLPFPKPLWGCTECYPQNSALDLPRNVEGVKRGR